MACVPGAEKTIFVPLRTPVHSRSGVAVALAVGVRVFACGTFGAGLPDVLHWKLRLLLRSGASASVMEL